MQRFGTIGRQYQSQGSEIQEDVNNSTADSAGLKESIVELKIDANQERFKAKNIVYNASKDNFLKLKNKFSSEYNSNNSKNEDERSENPSESSKLSSKLNKLVANRIHTKMDSFMNTNSKFDNMNTNFRFNNDFKKNL